MSALPVRPRSGLSLVRVGDVKAAHAPVVTMANGDKWRFAPGGPWIGGRHHFWSVDGSECLWCASRRSSAEIKAWFSAGQPVELCE